MLVVLLVELPVLFIFYYLNKAFEECYHSTLT